MRLFWIVLDSAGIGKAPDAAAFGDAGSDTWKRCYDTGDLVIPNMQKLGLYHIEEMDYGQRVSEPQGCFARVCESSQGKDTTTGHWEMAGIVSKQAFPTYPNGFPKEVIEAFERQTGRRVLCNKPYSGTEVIKDYGREHMETGALIVYTSADSVFQIAAHEEVIPVQQLYDYCQIARDILQGENAVARVIARPFIGDYPNFERTDRRHDFSLTPFRDTVLDALKAAGKKVIGVGKIYDIFAGQGITETTPNHGNDKNMQRVFAIQQEDFDGLCYINLVDFDMKYGHRRDITGYTKALNAFDVQLGTFMEAMREEDMVFITADHGCDPGYRGTDHTRETVPFLAYGSNLRKGVDLGVRSTYADIAATIAELFGIDYVADGTSFAGQMLR